MFCYVYTFSEENVPHFINKAKVQVLMIQTVSFNVSVHINYIHIIEAILPKSSGIKKKLRKLIQTGNKSEVKTWNKQNKHKCCHFLTT